MSGSNAIHGIILAGAMIVAGYAHGTLQTILAAVAVFLATGNIVGGAVVTDRMLGMFKGRQPGQPGAAKEDGAEKAGTEKAAGR
jgi:NAD(P) transhydrogenase subunit alpha